MTGLSERQRTVIATLVETAPDNAIRSLGLALAADRATDGPMAQIREMVRVEAAERVIRSMVFAPVVGLCRPSNNHFSKPFPGAAIGLLWRSVKAASPAQAQMAAAPAQTSTEVFDDLCLLAATGLRSPAGTPFAAAAAKLDEDREGGAESFAQHLDLAPLVRKLAPRVPEWLGRMTEDKAIVARLGYKDATAISPDAGPRLIEMLAADLEEPHHALRIVSAVMDHPEDVYLASSELSHIGERLLADVDAAIDAVTRLDPTLGVEAGSAAGHAASRAILIITEFENSTKLTKDGPWGQRVIEGKKRLAQSAETLIKKADEAVAAALPMKSAILVGRMKRGRPHLQNPPNAMAVARAESLAGFVETSRAGAQGAGFAAARGKAAEKLEERIDAYVDEVVDLIHENAEVAARAREYLDVAARLAGILRDDKAAQIIRRRATAA